MIYGWDDDGMDGMDGVLGYVGLVFRAGVFLRGLELGVCSCGAWRRAGQWRFGCIGYP